MAGRKRTQDQGAAVCPSARAEIGAVLIGVIGVDGQLAYLKTALQIDQDFIDEASRDGAPEERFRFAGACVEGRCVQWDDGQARCGVLDGVRPVLGDGAGDGSLQPCVIRGACRWFAQDGAPACRICPGVVTDIAQTA
ncbi:MAG TPA: hypothetical protein VGB91_11160 [Rhizomicrobium sp.]